MGWSGTRATRYVASDCLTSGSCGRCTRQAGWSSARVRQGRSRPLLAIQPGRAARAPAILRPAGSGRLEVEPSLAPSPGGVSARADAAQLRNRRGDLSSPCPARGPLAGALAGVFLIAMPRTFAHAHYAHYDMPMTCLWLLAQVAFVASLDSRRWAVAFGAALGLGEGRNSLACSPCSPPLSG